MAARFPRPSASRFATAVLVAIGISVGLAGAITIEDGVGDVPITEVVLDVDGVVTTQTASAVGLTAAGSESIEFVSITIDDGGPITLDEFNVVGATPANLGFPAGLTGVRTWENNVATQLADAGFMDALDRVQSSLDLRDYLAYDGLSSPGTGWNPDFDLVLDIPLRNEDYVLVAERFGNTFFDLIPLDRDGNPIAGAKTVGVDAAYRWNTGYAPTEQPAQPTWFTVFDVEQFGVDTFEDPIYGFRIDNDGEADIKFFGLDDEPFVPEMTLDKTVYEGHDGGASCEGTELASVEAGADVTYCFRIGNLGEAPLDDVTLTDADLGLTDVAAGDLIVVTGTTPIAQDGSITVAVEATATADLVNTATATADVLDRSGAVNPTLSPETAADTAEVEVIVPASISGTVVDEDGDPIPGVTIELSGDATASTVTDADGNYAFTGLAAGTYTVTEVQPVGYGDGGETAGSSGGTVSDDVIADIVLAEGDDSVDNDFDEVLGSLAGTVVDDLAAGIAGVTITLTGTTDAGDPVTLVTVTDSAGDYLFDDLLGGVYTVTETQPAGWLDGGETAGSTGGTVSDDVIADITLPAGVDSVDNDFDEVTVVDPASISGTVVDDLGRPIPGVTIELSGAGTATTTTDADGNYAFDGLAPGTYIVTETQPLGYGDGGETAGSAGGTIADDVIGDIILVAGTASVDNDFDETTGTITGRVVDQDDNPIEGVIIRLTGTDVTGATIDEVTATLPDGLYEFDGLLEGTYTVTETQPAGYDDGGESAGSAGGTVTDDVISAIALGAGQESVSNDFDELQPSPPTQDPTPAEPDDEPLPATGSETPLVVAFGLLFVVLGAILLVTRRLLTV